MQQVLEYVKNNYQNPAIYITENGLKFVANISLIGLSGNLMA